MELLPTSTERRHRFGNKCTVPLSGNIFQITDTQWRNRRLVAQMLAKCNSNGEAVGVRIIIELIKRAPHLCTSFSTQVGSFMSNFSHSHSLFVQTGEPDFDLLQSDMMVRLMGMRIMGFMHDLIVMLTFAPTVLKSTNYIVHTMCNL